MIILKENGAQHIPTMSLAAERHTLGYESVVPQVLQKGVWRLAAAIAPISDSTILECISGRCESENSSRRTRKGRGLQSPVIEALFHICHTAGPPSRRDQEKLIKAER